jgi:putative ABC transport system substrate-binding protein
MAVIVAVANGVWAAQAASKTIPIVGIPIPESLVPNLNRPAGNVTGLTGFLAQLGPKRLGLLHELLPRATTIAVLVNPTNVPEAPEEATDVQEAARVLGVQVNILNAATERDLDAAFASLAQMRANAVLVATDPFLRKSNRRARGEPCGSYLVLSP